jgi:hypothetical protein
VAEVCEDPAHDPHRIAHQFPVADVDHTLGQSCPTAIGSTPSDRTPKLTANMLQAEGGT